LDFAMAEGRYALAHNQDLDPRVLFDRQWARTVLDTVLQHLREEFAARGRSDVFDSLKGCLISPKGDSSYCALGKQLNMSEGAVKMTVHRMRRRYAELVWDEVARTVERPEDIEQELSYLIEMAGS
jgi:RNA polymerase sigma-70 factor (ECF subfamily)